MSIDELIAAVAAALNGCVAVSTRAELLVSSTRSDRVLRAIEIARAQQARSWELRAVMGLSRVWQRQDKTSEAGEMLAEIYAWFTEASAGVDLEDAKSLLTELTSPAGA